MERMKHTGDYELDEINMLEQECSDLEEENKKLKEDVDFYYKSAKQFREQVEKWEKDYREWNIVDARNG